jgi:hypothetical protein
MCVCATKLRPSLQLFESTSPRRLPCLCADEAGNILPSALLLLLQRRVAAGNGLGTGLGTSIKYLRRTASGAAGNGLGITIKNLLRTRNGAAGNGLGTTIKYL